MDKKEKYYNYIVDSLMRDTSLVAYGLKIKTPVRYEGDGSHYYINNPFSEDIDYLFNFSTNFRPDLRGLLFTMYGVSDEESEMVNVKYKQAMREKYSNNG